MEQNKGQKYEASLKLYSQDVLTSIDQRDILSIPEYSYFDIQMSSSNSDDRFLIPELDDYSVDNRVATSKSGAQFAYYPNIAYILFSGSWNHQIESSKHQDVPLTPGFYTIQVIHNNKSYFAYWQVVPKDLNDEEWKLMRRDVEDKVRGLALEYSVHKRNVVRALELGQVGDNYLDDDTAFLLSQQSEIQFAVEQLRNEAKFRISKSYSWKPSGMKAEIDQTTMRMIVDRPDKKGSLYSPTRYLEFNVPANQWLKLFIVTIVDVCVSQVSRITRVLEKLKSSFQSVSQYRGKRTPSEWHFIEESYSRGVSVLSEAMASLQKLRYYLSDVLHDDFLSSVQLPSNTSLPKILMLNPIYNLLYKSYSSLKHRSQHILFDDYYSKYWKKTAQLYEIWTYIQTLDALIQLGYVPRSGWIYDQKAGETSLLLPFLDEGTQVHLSNSSLSLLLTYNQPIKSRPSRSTHDRPLLTYSPRNKPDIRIDVFTLSNDFLGSIVLDAKYKKLNKLLSERTTEGHGQLADQFRAYRDDTYSTITTFKRVADIRIVESVLVLYPSNPVDQSVSVRESANHVYYIQLKPKTGFANLMDKLQERIANLHERETLLDNDISSPK
ncbi:nuclease domain-containing protein [Schleiferilactobacillus harbinensis]|nr:nuclease domain-containing protein [Schleiferilactobacillus harbinensis]